MKKLSFAALALCMSAVLFGQEAAEETKQTVLSPDKNGKYLLVEKLQDSRFIESLQSKSDMKLVKVAKGSISVPGKKGGAVRWKAVQKLEFANPVKNIKVMVNGYADHKNWSCSIQAGISADGKNPVMQKNVREKLGQKLTLELSAPEGTKECYLHFELANSSGVFKDGVAPAKLFGYNLEAK